MIIKEYKCQKCGYVLEVSDDLKENKCPNCGKKSTLVRVWSVHVRGAGNNPHNS